MTDFFSDELRGYRLIKGSRLTAADQQNILVQTQNSTAFFSVRRALQTMFSDEDDGSGGMKNRWMDGSMMMHGLVMVTIQGTTHGGMAMRQMMMLMTMMIFFDDDDDDDRGGGGSTWNAYYGDWTEDWQWEEAEDVPVDEQIADAAEVQYKEAFALANEATVILNEAEAVCNVRAARGYFAPESASGKGISGSPSSSKSSWSPKGSKTGKGKLLGAGKGKGFGPCFICGMKGHSYAQCPDRFSKGKDQFKGKGFMSKGKSGKGQSFSKSVQYHDLNCLAFPGVYVAEAAQRSRVILDTGASENAVGMESLQRLVTETNAVYKLFVRLTSQTNLFFVLAMVNISKL